MAFFFVLIMLEMQIAYFSIDKAHEKCIYNDCLTRDFICKAFGS
jgi:hypothetical protein